MIDFKDDDSVPEVILDINDLIGYEKTQVLIKAIGGIEFDFPKGEQDSEGKTLLESVLGVELSRKMMQTFGGEKLYIPKCTAILKQLRNQNFIDELKESIEQGYTKKFSVQQLAIKYGFSERWAYNIIKEFKDKGSI